MLAITQNSKELGRARKIARRTTAWKMQESASNYWDDMQPFSTKYRLRKFVSVKNTVAVSAKKSGMSTEICSSVLGPAWLFDSPVTTTHPKMKNIPRRCALANFSLNTA